MQSSFAVEFYHFRLSHDRGFFRALVFVACLSFAFPRVCSAFNGLSAIEQREVESRIAEFYASSSAAAMNRRVPKFSLSEGRFTSPDANATFPASTNPLIRLAGFKAGTAFQENYCERFLRKANPHLKCRRTRTGGWAAFESDDHVASLASGWMSSIDYDLDTLPTKGETSSPPWSDDYWRMRWGGLSFRYGEHPDGSGYSTYREAIHAYEQPDAWGQLLLRFGLLELSTKIDLWSPAEKYDLTLGDEAFTLTRQQKAVGSQYVGTDGNVESWFGLCHGWAPASLVVPRPERPVTVVGARGVPVIWYPADIRALVTLTWAMGQPSINSIGGICRDKNPKTYANGRLRSQECFDTNPATFHLALGNLIGRAHVGFVMDKSFDYEIWNQPIRSYEVTYFNPLDPKKTSDDWKQVAVDYDAAFKRVDRFQHPRSRGRRMDMGFGYADGGVRKIVGVVTTVTYVAEQHPPKHAAEDAPDVLKRVTYTYDLELYPYHGKLYPMGGEWHENSHPDYLWVPQSNAMAQSSFDRAPLGYSGEVTPWPALSSYAQAASAYGSPLCQVVKRLVTRSTGVQGYRCPVD